MPEPASDLTEMFSDRVRSALATGIPLNIRGSNSKAFYGRPATGDSFLVTGHRGIIHYEPTELVMTARCGTRLAEIETVLAEHGQMLAFEPPYFGSDATLGGAIATGLSGPRRPYCGSARDAVLGVKLLNGRCEILNFGGKVIKNVAGFDVARLMVGALGTLGLLLEVSLKVVPRPEHEMTIMFSLLPEAALMQINRWANQNWPITAASYDGELLYIRLSGATASIVQAGRKLGGEQLKGTAAIKFWSDLCEQRLPFFQGNTPLWRLSLAPATVHPLLVGAWLVDWGGALRWLKTDQAPEIIFKTAKALGGHASRFRSPLGGEFQPLCSGLEKLQRNIKHAFDPQGIFNPGRIYADW